MAPAAKVGTEWAALFARAQRLYDTQRYMDAYRETAAYWTPSTDIHQLTTAELLLAARLSSRLGGARLMRRMLYLAREREPENPSVRFYSDYLPRHGWRLFDDLRRWDSDLGGDDEFLRGLWFARHATCWALVRDFPRAYELLKRAHQLAPDDEWVLGCESSVHAAADRWEEALRAAERAFERAPGAPSGAMALGSALVQLGRVREAAERLSAAAENGQSCDIARAACWQLCAYAETLEGGPRQTAIERARAMCTAAGDLAPLADRDTRGTFARMRLDIAELADDHTEMERWAAELRSPFYRKVLASLRSNPGGTRIRLPYRRVMQKYMTCLPSSASAALEANGISIDAAAMAADVTFGGTAGWAAADWLRRRGLHVRFFTITADNAVRLIRNGIAFIGCWEGDDFAHAVAIVGLDEAAGTLLVHDPGAFRSTEYLLEGLEREQRPWGPKGIAAVPADKAALLDSLLPDGDTAVLEAVEAHLKALSTGGPSAARPIASDLAARFPSQPGTRLLQGLQALEDGRTSEAVAAFTEVLKEFPDSVSTRARLMTAYRSRGNTALTREILRGLVERGALPGVRSQQDWYYPPARYVAEYADLLRASESSRQRALALLSSVLRRQPRDGYAWHVLADLLWGERDFDSALYAYRLACCNSPDDEHYARAYCGALAIGGREQEGLNWLEARARASGLAPVAAPTWCTWISALEDFGHPEEAIAACGEALATFVESPEVLQFAVPFFARMGQWEWAEHLLQQLEACAGAGTYHNAAAQFCRMRGDLDQALLHAQSVVEEFPRWMQGRENLLSLLTQRHGAATALRRSAEWAAEQPGNDEIENAYLLQLDWRGPPRGPYYRLLRRRVKRNSEDAWAWRELAYCCMMQYSTMDKRRRARIERRVTRFIAECQRVAAGDTFTLAVHAKWQEERGQWREAVAGWLQIVEIDPDYLFGYRRAWEGSARLDADERRNVRARMEAALLSTPGRLYTAGEMVPWLAERFGVQEAEQVLDRWRQQRPEDPELLNAAATLLLEHGQARSDAERVLAMLKPAVAHFPYHFGLRQALATAHRMLGENEQAQELLRDLMRRHPANSTALLQLAWAQERSDDLDDAGRTVALAIERDPHNGATWDARVQILMGRGRHEDAREVIETALWQMPANAWWRSRAIGLLQQCGAYERAVEVAREGPRLRPAVAYLWFLLGQTLEQSPQYAAAGEVESCYRRSIELDGSLLDPADLLAVRLVEQRRYAEAEELMQFAESVRADPSPARGRLAWIRREKGERREAREDATALVTSAPWYAWGWAMLMQWLQEDEEWDGARELLATVPPQMRSNTAFRVRRLKLLGVAGLTPSELDTEWNELLRDFPEIVPLHLERYDLLRENGRTSEAAAILAAIPAWLDDPYVQARRVEVLLGEFRNEEALADALRVLFAPAEESTWPAHHVWTKVAEAGLTAALYSRARRCMEQGQCPTPQSLALIATHACRQMPDARTGAKERATLLEQMDGAPWGDGQRRARLLQAFSDNGQGLLVIDYWKKHRALVESDVGCWAQVAAVLSDNGRKKDTRKMLAGWRTRSGVRMWMVAVYVDTLGHSRGDRRSAMESARDALTTLPHDHCAKFLACVLAECCIVLGDRAGFLEVWNTHRHYFETPLTNEWFADNRRHLIGEIPTLARLLENSDFRLYNQGARSLRWRHIWGDSGAWASYLPWWLWILMPGAVANLFRGCN